jgi:hypothetical protein
MWKVLATTVIVVCATAADAHAQGVQRPTRPYRGLFGGGPAPDPNRTRQELTLSGDFSVGYDTWLMPGGSVGAVDLTTEQQHGRGAIGSVGLSYMRGRTQRSISIDGNARANGYSGIDAPSTVAGDLQFAAETRAGRTTQVRFSQDLRYEPTLVLGDASSPDWAGDASLPPPIIVPSNYLEQRSWSATSSASFDKRWSARHTTQISGAYSRIEYLDDIGNDSRAVFADAMYAWTLSRSSSLQAHYLITDSDLRGTDGFTTPVRDQIVEVTVAYDRRLSSTRRLTLSGGGGGTYVSTVAAADRSSLAYWMPSGRGSASLDVGRSWALSGSYGRSATVLQGVSLTSFATDSASVNVTGLVNRRIETAISANYSTGRSGGAGTQGRYENYSGALQALYAISRWCAVSVNYDYFVYRFRNIVDLPTSVPPYYDRQAIRGGITISLPLYGTYVGAAGSSGALRN